MFLVGNGITYFDRNTVTFRKIRHYFSVIIALNGKAGIDSDIEFIYRLISYAKRKIQTGNI